MDFIHYKIFGLNVPMKSDMVTQDIQEVQGLKLPHSLIKIIVLRVEYICDLRSQEKYEAPQINPTTLSAPLPVILI